MPLHTVSAFARIGEENAFAVLARATELQRQGRDIINLGIGQPDFATPAHIVEAAIKAKVEMIKGIAEGIPERFFGDWQPTEADIALNKERIDERLVEMAAKSKRKVPTLSD